MCLAKTVGSAMLEVNHGEPERHHEGVHRDVPELTAGWPFEAVRSLESAETTETRLTLAASLQRMPRSEDIWEYLMKYTMTHLLVSPYLSHHHLLDIRTVGKQEQLLSTALMLLAPVRDDWGSAPYLTAFNWPIVIEALRLLVRAQNFTWREQTFFTVAFRSVLSPTADYARLLELDEEAHVEATKSGGLLKYWFGEPDINRRNLATCEQTLPKSNYHAHKAAKFTNRTLRHMAKG